MSDMKTETNPNDPRLPLLFTAETLQALLARYLLMTENQRGRNNQRVRLVAANLTGHYDLVPELQW